MTQISIISAICKLLVDNAAIFAIVKDRVWPIILNQGQSPPFIVVETLSGANADSDDGESDLNFPQIGINIWSKTEDQQAILRNKVNEILFTEVQQTVQNIKIECGIYITEQDIYYEPLDLKGKRIDFEVWYRNIDFYT